MKSEVLNEDTREVLSVKDLNFIYNDFRFAFEIINEQEFYKLSFQDYKESTNIFSSILKEWKFFIKKYGNNTTRNNT